MVKKLETPAAFLASTMKLVTAFDNVGVKEKMPLPSAVVVSGVVLALLTSVNVASGEVVPVSVTVCGFVVGSTWFGLVMTTPPVALTRVPREVFDVVRTSPPVVLTVRVGVI